VTTSVLLQEIEDRCRLTVEAGKARVIIGEDMVYLSAAEVAILARLYRARGSLVPISLLEDALYQQPGCEEIMGEIKYHIRNLRRKLGDYDRSLIYCRRHLGYGLEVGRVSWQGE